MTLPDSGETSDEPLSLPNLNLPLRLQLGDIQLREVAALITPGMEGHEVLLGMSALKQLEFTQKGGTLVLRQSTR